MHNVISVASLTLLAILALNCQADEGANTMQYNTVFSKGDQGPKEIFTNTTWVKMLHTDDDGVFDTQVFDAIFEPSARTHWHSHPGGQILLVTDGTGYYQEKVNRRDCQNQAT